MSNIILLVDNSYSVRHHAENYVNTINGIIADLPPDSLLTLVTFNETSNYLCVKKRVGDIERGLTVQELNPIGLTAMFDNLCRILTRLLRFDDTIEQKSSTTVIIITDGEDNASTRLNAKLLAVQIALCKSRGWKFLFFGVTDTSVQLGRALGCNFCLHYANTTECFQRVRTVTKDLTENLPEKDMDIDLCRLMTEMKID